MAKYLFQASYTAEGAQGLLKEGGSSRRATIEKITEAMGGTLESFHFAFGATDAYVIAEVPDHETAIAVSLAVNASGAVNVRTIPLLTPEEVDRATKKTVGYRPPGA